MSTTPSAPRGLAPKNSAGHQALLDPEFASVHGIDVDRVRELLWLLHAPPDLSELYHVLMNLAAVLKTAIGQWPDILKWQGLDWIPDLIEKLIPAVMVIQGNLEQFAKDYHRDWRDRNALYCAFRCDLSETQLLRFQYQLLQAHYFFAHAVVLRRNEKKLPQPTDLNGYESYGGTDEWPAFQIQPYLAGLCIRDMAAKENSGWASELLENLPVTLQPRELAARENTEVQSRLKDVDVQKKVNYVPAFLRQAYGLKQRGIGKGSAPRIRSGYSEIGDPDDPWLNYGVLSDWEAVPLGLPLVNPLVLPSIPEHQQEGTSSESHASTNSEAALNHPPIPREEDETDGKDEDNLDGFDGEDEEEGFDGNYDCEDEKSQESPGSFEGRAIGLVHKLVREQKIFSFGIERISPQELYGLASAGFLRLMHLAEDRKKFRGNSMPTAVHQRAGCKGMGRRDEFEARLLLSVALWTGREEKRALSLVLVKTETDLQDESFAFIADDPKQKGPVFRERVPFPEYRKEQKGVPEHDCNRSQYIYLPDVMGLGTWIKRYAELFGYKGKERHQVFQKAFTFYSKNVKALLKAWDPSGRLTLNKVSSALFGKLMNWTGNDAVAAALITGKPHRLSKVPLYYACRNAKHVQEIYFSVVEQLKSEIDQEELRRGITLESAASRPRAEGNSEKRLRPKDIGASKQTVFIGKRLCPRMDAVLAAVQAIKSKLCRPYFTSSNEAWIEFHNFYTLYTVWGFLMATGTRKIITPYVAFSEVSPLNHVAILRDKDNDAGSKAKLIWVPDTILDQMRFYSEHLKFIKERFTVKHQDEPCFFLKEETGRSILVRPKTFSGYMNDLLPGFPVDIHRRFMYNILLDYGCPPEFVRVWMGHACVGEEWWSEHATFSHQVYRHYVNEYLSPILTHLGFKPVPWKARWNKGMEIAAHG